MTAIENSNLNLDSVRLSVDSSSESLTRRCPWCLSLRGLSLQTLHDRRLTRGMKLSSFISADCSVEISLQTGAVQDHLRAAAAAVHKAVRSMHVSSLDTPMIPTVLAAGLCTPFYTASLCHITFFRVAGAEVCLPLRRISS